MAWILLAAVAGCGSTTPDPTVAPTELGPSTTVASPDPELELVVGPAEYASLGQATGLLAHPAADEPFIALEEGTFFAIIGRSGPAPFVEVTDPSTGEMVFGWLPDDTVIQRERPAQCPRFMDDIGILHPQRQLECANRQFAIEGYVVGMGEPARAYEGTPAWLASRASVGLASAFGPAVTAGSFIDLHVPPDLAIEDSLIARADDLFIQRVRVVGHLSDASADECEREPRLPGYPDLPPEVDALWCAQRFVVEGVQPIPEEE